MSYRSSYPLSSRKKYYPVDSTCILYHAYWDGTAKDHSIYDNHGTLSGCTYVEKGLQFNGSTDHVVIANDTELNPPAGNFDLTIDAWVNVDAGVSNWGFAVSKGSWGTGNYVLGYNNAGKIYYQISGLTPSSGNGDTVISGDGWHHIALTSNGTNHILYLDTAVEKTDPITGDSYNINASDLWIGQQTDTAYPFDGVIGEHRIWNFGLTEAQLIDIFNFTKHRYI